MNQQILQPESKKGLTKGCTVALIIGGAVIVLIAVVVILIVANRDKVARWAFVSAVNTERALIMANSIDGIDTVVINKVADEFIKNLEVGEVDPEKMTPFGDFVAQYVKDMKVDSAEAVAYVQAMIECYPELAGLYQPMQTIDTSAVIDTTVTAQ
jgi:hypothetical protein